MGRGIGFGGKGEFITNLLTALFDCLPSLRIREWIEENKHGFILFQQISNIILVVLPNSIEYSVYIYINTCCLSQRKHILTHMSIINIINTNYTSQITIPTEYAPASYTGCACCPAQRSRSELNSTVQQTA